MTSYRLYVRGHGGEEAHRLPPSEPLPIDVVTVGEFGCTMTAGVADDCIYGHWTLATLTELAARQDLIYWTAADRQRYREAGELWFRQPTVVTSFFDTISANLVLEGAADIGTCGLCYWDEARGELVWLKRLGDREELYLAEILVIVKELLGPDDTAQIFWTACQSARYSRGQGWQVAWHPGRSSGSAVVTPGQEPSAEESPRPVP